MASLTLNPVVDPATGQPYADPAPHLADAVTFTVTDLPHNLSQRAKGQIYVEARQAGIVVYGGVLYTPNLDAPLRLGMDTSGWNTNGGPADCTATLRTDQGETLDQISFVAGDRR